VKIIFHLLLLLAVADSVKASSTTRKIQASYSIEEAEEA
jgi:hypothetical protein